MKLNHTEIAWAAGFFDGEGCIGCHSMGPGNSSRRRVRIVIEQVDRRPLDRFKAAMGGHGNINGPYRPPCSTPNQRSIHQFAMTSHKLSQFSIALMWKYLSEPKREQAVRAFQKWYSISPMALRKKAT